MDAKPLRAAIYTRVSTEDQAKEGFSLDAQVDKLRSYCKARDWIVTEEYIDDGYSGRNTKRPAYSRMLEEIDKWDTIPFIKRRPLKFDGEWEPYTQDRRKKS